MMSFNGPSSIDSTDTTVASSTGGVSSATSTFAPLSSSPSSQFQQSPPTKNDNSNNLTKTTYIIGNIGHNDGKFLKLGSTDLEEVATTTTGTVPQPQKELTSNFLAPILPICCQNTTAELHKAKFGSGTKGKCIKFNDVWYTPRQFQLLSDGNKFLDWKRSIRCCGRTLRSLIDKKFLELHSLACTCAACLDDEVVYVKGPIKPDVPYHRRGEKRKAPSNDDGDGGSTTATTTAKKSSSNIRTSPAPAPSTSSNSNFAPPPPPSTNVFDRLEIWETYANQIISAATNLKSFVQEIKHRSSQERHQLQSQLVNSSKICTQAKNTWLEGKHGPQLAHSAEIKQFMDPNAIYSVFEFGDIQRIIKPGEEGCAAEASSSSSSSSSSLPSLPTLPDLPEPTTATINYKCQNCNREGNLVCSGCESTYYCSTFCQQKDWPFHAFVCFVNQNQEVELNVEEF